MNYLLEDVHIHRGYTYSRQEKPSPLRCRVKFRAIGAGTVELDLDEDASRAVLAVCAEQVVKAASLRADDMKAAFVDATSPAIEAAS